MPNRRIRRKREKQLLRRTLDAARSVLARHREVFEALAEWDRDPAPEWLRVLGPVPDDARVDLRPFVAGGSGITEAGGEPVFEGWTQRVVILASGTLGIRAIVVGADATGRLTMASDTVVRGPFPASAGRTADTASHRATSVGGRFETDGEFQGTRWDGAASRPPTASEIVALSALAGDLLRRPAAPASPEARH
ncbi:MAG TPA: hypothetical protein VGD77_11755 [Gemmatimonadaceae bacterium]